MDLQRGERGMQTVIFNLRYFIPRKNIWLKRFMLLLGFIMFDYIVTLAFCNIPVQEANVYARAFMEVFGIPFGLTLFSIITTTPIYLVFSIDSHLVNLPQKITQRMDPIIDFIFAWSVAGAHFNGATSWFWNATTLTRQLVGTMFYLLLASLLLYIKKSE
jgi:hypothetical protein